MFQTCFISLRNFNQKVVINFESSDNFPETCVLDDTYHDEIFL